jgi:hypothetical protein
LRRRSSREPDEAGLAVGERAAGDGAGGGDPGPDPGDGGGGGPGDDLLAGGFDNDLINGGSGDDFLAGELPPDSPPPVPAEPAENDRCIGASGVDTALECDVTVAIEEIQG